VRSAAAEAPICLEQRLGGRERGPELSRQRPLDLVRHAHVAIVRRDPHVAIRRSSRTRCGETRTRGPSRDGQNHLVLRETAAALVAPGKGILAADESDGTIGRRFAAVGVESTEDTRRAYRELLLGAPGVEDYLSGVILFDETIRQRTSDGTPFAELLAAKGIVPGIKVDKGAKPLPQADGETVTEGLDGLRERLEEYRALGARFAKWRAVYTIGAGRPSEYAVWTNAHALARYAALCQEADIVPIVEPEVLMDGDHGLDESFRATSRAQHALFTRRSGACATTSRPRCRASFSSPAARTTSPRPRTSTPWPASARTRGSSRSRTPARSRTWRWSSGTGTLRTSTRRGPRSCTERG
jgi:hypothetical protein